MASTSTPGMKRKSSTYILLHSLRDLRSMFTTTSNVNDDLQGGSSNIPQMVRCLSPEYSIVCPIGSFSPNTRLADNLLLPAVLLPQDRFLFAPWKNGSANPSSKGHPCPGRGNILRSLLPSLPHIYGWTPVCLMSPPQRHCASCLPIPSPSR